MSPHRLLCFCATLLLASCAMDSNWHLMDSGYSINPVAGETDAYAVEMHLNQLMALGGDVNSQQVRAFVAENLKLHGLCPSGWQPLPCVEDGSCLKHTRRSVTLHGRCLAS